MKSSSFYSISTRDKLGPWRGLSEVKLPVIAAVNGLALGGGCEIAMMCDIILASDKAQFGQPEIKLGILPGAGGTQRLPRFIGKSKAMELCLTGNMMSAADAEKYGLVSRVVPHDQLLDVAVKMATTIANYSRVRYTSNPLLSSAVCFAFGLVPISLTPMCCVVACGYDS